MKKAARPTSLLILCGIVFSTCTTTTVKAQGIDTIAFHLYTDSLKKGVHNYINVDGQPFGGKWVPLTGKDLDFSSTSGSFEGNNLIIDRNFRGEKVTITATYKRNPKLSLTTTLFIKVNEDNESLPAETSVNTPKRKRKGNR
ncbi:hypothetical protein [Flavihumibacter fluvii]|uniref:hypothetical protein n=1 Tax=Flavihumibacter fluvii TaxID=2838157 RepID=UPI001BDED92E|nr:hypothetical protein [Flavihumibacter fluvii]ULQ53582.1 hypothetical protein KJS93_04515 [Flavihumibacter fluvii]